MQGGPQLGLGGMKTFTDMRSRGVHVLPPEYGCVCFRKASINRPEEKLQLSGMRWHYGNLASDDKDAGVYDGMNCG